MWILLWFFLSPFIFYYIYLWTATCDWSKVEVSLDYTKTKPSTKWERKMAASRAKLRAIISFSYSFLFLCCFICCFPFCAAVVSLSRGGALRECCNEDSRTPPTKQYSTRLEILSCRFLFMLITKFYFDARFELHGKSFSFYFFPIANRWDYDFLFFAVSLFEWQHSYQLPIRCCYSQFMIIATYNLAHSARRHRHAPLC